MRFQVYISAFAATLYMANASDSLGNANIAAPIDLFTVADAHAMTSAQPAPKKPQKPK